MERYFLYTKEHLGNDLTGYTSRDEAFNAAAMLLSKYSTNTLGCVMIFKGVGQWNDVVNKAENYVTEVFRRSDVNC